MRIPPVPRGRLAAAILLLVAVSCAYGRTLSHPFASYDDPRYLTINPVVSKGLTADGIAWAFRSLEVSNWHPLAWISHMIDVSLFGMNPAGHHAVNVLLHGAVSVLFFLVLAALTGAPGKSLAAALVFSLHPLRVEVVAWVAERKELLSALFFLLAAGAYVRYARRPSKGRYAAVAAFFVPALLSKPMAVTFPFILLLLDFWPLARFPFARRHAEAGDGAAGGGPLPAPAATSRLLLEKAPLMLLSAASSLVTLHAQTAGGSTAEGALPLGFRCRNALSATAAYLGKTVLPIDLGPYYPHPYLTGAGISALKWGGAALFLIAATSLLLRQAKRRPFLLAGWFWFLGALVPVSGLVQVGLQSMADRYTYLPGMGLSILAVWGTASLLPRDAERNIGGMILTVLAAGALGTASIHQAGYWKTSSLLFERALAAGGESFVSLDLLGLAYSEDGRHADAAGAFQRALRLKPDDPKVWSNLAVSFDRMGRPDLAARAYGEVLRLRPRLAQVREMLALARAKAGDFPGAMEALSEVSDQRHGDVSHFPAVADVYERTSRPDLAASVYEEMVRRRPDHAGAWNNLGADYGAMKRYEEALAAFRKAVSLRPKWSEAWYNMGVAAVLAGRRGEAEEARRELDLLDPARASSLRAFVESASRRRGNGGAWRAR